MKDTEITFDKLKENLKFTDDYFYSKLNEAYLFACEEHEGIKRLSGDDYITHPLHVANILTTLNVDEVTIIMQTIKEKAKYQNNYKT